MLIGMWFDKAPVLFLAVAAAAFVIGLNIFAYLSLQVRCQSDNVVAQPEFVLAPICIICNKYTHCTSRHVLPSSHDLVHIQAQSQVDREVVAVDQRSSAVDLDQTNAYLDLDTTSRQTISRQKDAPTPEFLLVSLFFQCHPYSS